MGAGGVGGGEKGGNGGMGGNGGGGGGERRGGWGNGGWGWVGKWGEEGDDGMKRDCGAVLLWGSVMSLWGSRGAVRGAVHEAVSLWGGVTIGQCRYGAAVGQCLY